MLMEKGRTDIRTVKDQFVGMEGTVRVFGTDGKDGGSGGGSGCGGGGGGCDAGAVIYVENVYCQYEER